MLTLKALHIIFIVSWFAGLLYISRIFIYHVEAKERPDAERKVLEKQFKLMAKRLWYAITWPACILTFIFGPVLLLVYYPGFLQLPFMHIKLGFVFLLFVYQLITHRIFVNLQNDQGKYTSTGLRIWNEVATLFLVAITFIIVMKNDFNWIYGTVGFILFGILIMLAIKIYKHIRTKK